MRLQEIMSQHVATVSPEEALAVARKRLEDADVHQLVVMDRGRVVGVASRRDLDRPDATTVGDVMTLAVTAAPRETVRDAANRMRGLSVGVLPIVDGEKLVGIVTITDVLGLIGRGVLGRAEHAASGHNGNVRRRGSVAPPR